MTEQEIFDKVAGILEDRFDLDKSKVTNELDFKKDFDEAKPKDDKPEDDKAPADDKGAEVQSLKEQIATLQSFMPHVNKKSLSLSQEMAYDRLR